MLNSKQDRRHMRMTATDNVAVTERKQNARCMCVCAAAPTWQSYVYSRCTG